VAPEPGGVGEDPGVAASLRGRRVHHRLVQRKERLVLLGPELRPAGRAAGSELGGRGAGRGAACSAPSRAPSLARS